MAGPEPSEIFCAAAMCFDEKYIDQFLRDTGKNSPIINLTQNFFPEAEKAFRNDVVIEGSRTAYDALFAEKDIFKNSGTAGDMVRGISAAKAIKQWMKDAHHISNPTAEKVYMTGSKWPEQVAPLAVKAHGFDAYNSSDIIIQPLGHPNAYFGISLKKKKTTNDQDPTLINKAFDTLLQGDTFDKVKKQLEMKRKHYFTKLVIQAINDGHIKKPTKVGLNALHKPSKASRQAENFARAFIDTKGSMKMPEILGPKDFTTAEKKINGIEKIYGLATEHKSTLLQMVMDKKPINANTIPASSWNYYGDGSIGDAKFPKAALNRGALSSRKTETMRGWVNSKLANKQESIYKEFIKTMEDNGDLFVNQLINLTLKTDLPNQMKAKNLGDMNFGFALVTGIGGVTAGKKLWTDKGQILMEKGKAFDIHTILCGLASLDANPNKYTFKVVETEVDDEVDDDDGAAKVYFDIMKGNITLFNMELRYKGQFVPQPQFQGKLHKDFVKIMEDECLVKR
tara:strand:- start:45 stop:1574 length:1530 start_codon:yes stop_codon:yes gene_type:complete